MKRAIAILVLLALSASITPTAAASYREGVISHMGPGFPDDYLAIPEHTKGSLYRICAVRCVNLRQNDYGPDQGVHPDRIADVSVETFVYICGCDMSQGLVRGSWTLITSDDLPATDTE